MTANRTYYPYMENYNSSDPTKFTISCNTMVDNVRKQSFIVCDKDGIDHIFYSAGAYQSERFLPWSLTEFKDTMTGGNSYGHPSLYNGPTVSDDRNDYLLIGSSFVRNDISPNQFYRSEIQVNSDGFFYKYNENPGQTTTSKMLPWTRGRINTHLVFNKNGIARDFHGTTLAFIIVGFCQNIGNVFIAVSIMNGTILYKKDLLTGADWDHAALTISFSGTTLTLSSNADGYNYVSLFGDGISDAYM